jgi:hypothetical protein
MIVAVEKIKQGWIPPVYNSQNTIMLENTYSL